MATQPTELQAAEQEFAVALRGYQIARDVDFVEASERYHAAAERLEQARKAAGIED